MSSPPPHRSTGKEPSIENPKKKREKPSPPVLPQTSQSTPVPSIPDDLLLSCLARISRLHYPALSLVYKSFRSLIDSPELYETRSLLGRTESCLYVCFHFSPGPHSRWFTLCQKPRRTITNGDTSVSEKKKKDESSGHLLVPVAIPNSPKAHWQSVVTVGSNVYAIGGTIEDSPSSSVWVLDCHCHVWRKAPSMHVERACPAANVVDGKIYVAGGGSNYNSSNWMEVFDPKTQTWELVMCPLAERCRGRVKSAVIKGRILYMFANHGVAYMPEEDNWEAIQGPSHLKLESYCVIDNVLCSCHIPVGFGWYDFKRQSWNNMRGLRGLPKFDLEDCVKMADYGGELAVFWTKSFVARRYEEKTIWSCAVISLERRNGDEIWATVEWIDPLLTLPNPLNKFVCAIASTF